MNHNQTQTSIDERPAASVSAFAPSLPVSARLRAWACSELGLALIALGACWLLLFDALRGEWSINPQYSYGWCVPLLGAALLWRRWPERPLPSPPTGAKWVAFIAGSLLLLILPLRVILEANPEWRLLYWFGAGQVIGLSLCLLYVMGGRPWLCFFAAPLLFMLIAVPWPMQLEQVVIQGLMRFIAGLTVNVVGWLGIPAVQRGNLVEVGAGMVGIDEACSGVRSLQSALMISLFLGELHRFTLARRAWLLLASIVFVLAANLARTSFLVWAGAERGFEQMQAWHDTAGTLVMFIVLPGLLGLAWLMKPRTPREVFSTAGETGRLPALPRWVGLTVLAWLVTVEISTEAWYRTHETRLVANPAWSVAWPKESFRFKQSPLPENALAILRCSDSQSATWQDENGHAWSAFLLRWDPGENSAQLAKGHRPDICLTATGANLADDLGIVNAAANSIELNFRHQTFESGPHLLHVFYCLWADRGSPGGDGLLEDGSQASRLQAVLAGKRHLGQQVMEVVLQGPHSAEEAVAVLRAELPSLIQRR